MAKSYRRSSISYEDDLEQYYQKEYKYKKKISNQQRKKRKVNYKNVNDVMNYIEEDYDELRYK